MKNLLFILTLLIGFCSCQKEPSRIYIKKITVNAISYSDSNGNPWETDGTSPDLYIIITQGTGGGVITEFTITQNNVNFTTPPSWNLNTSISPSQSYNIELYEAGSSNRKMIELPFKHTEGGSQPSRVTLSKNGYYVDLDLEYKF